MMLEELYDILRQETRFSLSGKLTFNGSYIKWEYDALSANIEEDLEDHLNMIYLDDLEIMKEFIDEDEFIVSTPEVEDTFIFFYIEK